MKKLYPVFIIFKHALVFSLTCISTLFGATYTSTQNGVWSSAVTWGGSGIPGDGDDVVIQHNITITSNQAIGIGSGTAVTINNSGTLTLNQSIALTCKGNITASGTIIMEAGSVIEMDTPTPSIIQLTPGNTFAHLKINGTSSLHCSIKAIGTGHTKISDNDESGGGRIIAEFCNFTKLGGSSDYRAIQYYPTSTGEHFSFVNCTFDQCSRIKVNDYENLSVPAGAYINFEHCKWTNSIKDPNANPDGIWEIFETWSNKGVTFKILNCDFDKKVALMRPWNLEIENCVFRKGIISYSGEYMGGKIKSFKNNFIRWHNEDGVDAELAYGSTIEDCIFIIDNQGWNPHYIGIAGGSGATNVIGNIWWYTGTHPDAEGDGVIINSPDSLSASENIITIEKNIYLPNSNGYNGVHGLSCTGFSINWEEKNRQVVFKRNTLYTGHWGGGINIGETMPTSTGNIAYIKSNLFIGDINGEGSKMSNMDHVETDAFLAENVNYNAGFRIPEGAAYGNGSGKGYDIFPFSGSSVVGANDIDDVDPQFVDHDRTPASWSGSLDETMNRLSPGGGYQMTQLLQYIREGFTPQNSLLDNAGDPADGSPDIGAVDFGSPVSIKTKTYINEFELNQNYPNPFNPTTNISYTLPNDSNVRLTIINVLGQEVKELINENKKAGFHNYTFDGSSFSSGVYYYRIATESFTETKQMLLVK